LSSSLGVCGTWGVERSFVLTVTSALPAGPESPPASRLFNQVIAFPADVPAQGFVVDWQVEELAGPGPAAPAPS